MKLRYTLLVFALFAATFAIIGCSGPASTSYQNVSVTLSYYPVSNGSAISGTFPVVAPGAGNFNGAVICSPASAYCTNQGTQLCSPTTETCMASGTVELAAGGNSGSCIELLATVTNAPVNLTYTIIPSPILTSGSSNVGTVSQPNGTTAFYCEANSIPVYSGAQLAQAQAAGLPNGITEVVVSNPADPNDPSKVATAQMFFTYQLAPTLIPGNILVGIYQAPSVIVPLSKTQQFTGYVLGINGYTVPAGATAPTGGCVVAIPGQCVPAININWSVGACTGGPALVAGTNNYGTINTSTGLYTAPATYPSATTHCANIQATSAAYPTIMSSITTVNFP